VSQFEISKTAFQIREDLLGSLDEVGVGMLSAIKPQPAAVRARRFKGDVAAFARVIPAQPTEERSHVVVARRKELAAGNRSIVEFLTVSVRRDGDDQRDGVKDAATHNPPPWKQLYMAHDFVGAVVTWLA
jgi:hypothetical protein